MTCKRVPCGIICVTPDIKIGDPPPSGYVAWQEWAAKHYRAGYRQTRCPKCLLLNFPQELKDGQCVKCKAATPQKGTESE